MEYQAKLVYDASLLKEALHGFFWRWVSARFLLLIVVLFALTVYLWLSGDRSWQLGGSSASFIFCFILGVTIYRVHDTNMKLKLKDMGSPEAMFTASDDSFTVATGAGSSTLPWSSITDVLKLKRCWLLYFSKGQFMTLPLAGVSKEMQEFTLKRISSAGGKSGG